MRLGVKASISIPGMDAAMLLTGTFLSIICIKCIIIGCITTKYGQMVMNILFAIYQFFGGDNHFGIDLPVSGLIALLFFLSAGFRYHTLARVEKQGRARPAEIVWFGVKIIIIIVVGTLSLKLIIFTGLYVFLLTGKVSFTLARGAAKTGWKVLHGISFILFIFVIPAMLFIVAIIVNYIYELGFGMASAIIFLLFNIKLPRSAEGRIVISKVFQNFKESPRHVKAGLIGAIVIGAIFPIGLAAGQIVVENIMLPMRDGVRLATTIYRPAWEVGNMPVILIRTPYNKDASAGTALSWYNKGYIVVTQDTRGCYASEGAFDAFLNTGNDGYDTCKWIVAQPWCNGKIGTTGYSALSMVQYPMAGLQAPGLIVQEMDMGTPDLYDEYYRGGAWMQSDVGGWIHANTASNPALEYAIIDSILAHPDKNSSYWAPSSLATDDKYANVSTRAVHFAGWFDLFQQNTINGFMGYYYNGSAFARGHQKLVIGPWVHAYDTPSITIGGVELSYPNSNDPVSGKWREAIFDESLQPTALSTGDLDALSIWSQPNVAYYVMGDITNPNSGANQWRYANDWPIPGYHETPLYLQTNGSLSWITPGSSKNFTYIYDPRHPMQTIGGTNLAFDNTLKYNSSSVYNSSIGWGSWDQQPLLNRHDVLVFNSSQLSQSVEAVGDVKTRLFIASNCTNTDFVAKLCDVYPSGQSMLVADGIINTYKRDSVNKDEKMTALHVYEVDVDLWSTAYRFGAGHKIQLVISSSNAPKYLPNPNTGAPLARTYSTFYDANNTILVDPSHPSCLYLPLGPSS